MVALSSVWLLRAVLEFSTLNVTQSAEESRFDT